MKPIARIQSSFSAVSLALLLAACSTLGTESEPVEGLPTSGIGPFRRLEGMETAGVAPFVFDSEPARYRDPAALPEGDGVLLYAVALDREVERDVIVRTRANDGRAFYGANVDSGHTAPTILRADQAWEGENLSGPAPLRVGNEIWLYYAGRDGVGLARSKDGLTFTKEAAPILVAGDEGIPSAPSVLLREDGTFDLLYAAGCALYEATSTDGVHFVRLDPDLTTPSLDALLRVSAPKTNLLPGEKPPFDTDCLSDPHVTTRITPAGRLQFRVLYTGFASDQTTIGFAARYGLSGALVRNDLPAFSAGLHERGPTTYERGDLLFLYVSLDKKGSRNTFPTIGAGLAPATMHLEKPAAFPESP